MSEALSAEVDLTGPFFQRDPGETVRGNIERMMQGLADEGAQAARRGLSVGSGGRRPIRLLGDRVADHVVGRTHARPSKGGRRWRASAVVQVYNEGLDGASSKSLNAAASSVERRIHVFRSVGRQIRNARAVLGADLTEGIE